ncbi:MAG: ATP-dependent DNA helicase RecG [Ardenticatenaceae bacterium]
MASRESGRTTGPHRESSPNTPHASGRGRGGASSAQPSWGPTNTKRAAPRRRSLPPEVALRLDGELDRPVTSLPGVGKSRAKKLEKLNISTIRHLLYHAPFRYEDYTTMKQIAELRPGDEVTLAVVVQEIDMYKSKRGTVVVTAMVSDGSGRLQVKWFGNRYLVNHLRKGTMVRLSGKMDAYMGRLQLAGPRFEVVNESEVRGGDLIPIYSRTEGLSEKALSKYITLALSEYAGRIPDPLPSEVCEHYELIRLSQAIRWVHQASSMEQVQAAQKRLAFDELLRVQLGMLQQRAAWQNQPGNTIQADHAAIERFYGSLPFELTGAQKRCVEEILLDMGQSYAMSRLLQGDVGSGKTAVAATALIAAVSAGFQGALMAPTEILAEQHFAGVSKFLNPEGTLFLKDRPIRLALLTGSLSASEKREARDAIAKGEADVVIGTHAIIQEDVTFPKLGLAIVDEQHRFGVKQRSALRKRTSDGVTPDLLVMSATPIPRSLALTLYGDLELSLIDEMPPGRQPIVTRTITPQLRERAYTYIRRQIQSGRQAFIICPLVEESEKLEARAAVEEHAVLQQQVFPEYSVELLHGRMKSSEKEAAMARFYRNDSQILVSTSVVEVGIDVPNANVMLIEGANRFGLAQLHQFRGRIGRGQWRSLCLLMAEEGISEEAQQRLQALVDNSDGFALAEEDLKMRGPGDFFGTRQSGMLELKMAKLGDTLTLSKAREAAKQILYHDPKLEHPAHQLLKAQTEKSWNKEADGAS